MAAQVKLCEHEGETRPLSDVRLVEDDERTKGKLTAKLPRLLNTTGDPVTLLQNSQYYM